MPDIDQLCRDVLAASERITPLPWERDVDRIIAAAEVDEFNGGEGYGTATLFQSGGSMRIPVGREKANTDYAVAACNAAPTLARECQRLREALLKIQQWDCINPEPAKHLCLDLPWLKQLVEAALKQEPRQ